MQVDGFLKRYAKRYVVLTTKGLPEILVNTSTAFTYTEYSG